jgi:hypothetical protein
MAVMPTLSRNLWFAVLARTWNIVRSYFVTGTERRRGAAVLSFRRHAGPAAAFRRVAAQENFASKKPNGTVGIANVKQHLRREAEDSGSVFASKGVVKHT